ncbi:MAG: asparagine synthase (glutamine-hydrolyzing) [Chloroflexi bacterium]|nr:asparagine synthase (glutamine-hydrolyzing) [Chloroflexota bacterium]
MCGICGIAGENASTAVVEDMLHSIAHRGPDGAGMFTDTGIAMGNTRLAIIDLNTGDQPIANENCTVWVVFNGEIYNHRALRSELEARGHHFKTQGDTEVLVHAYEEWGVNYFARLDGIFAFALYDLCTRRLILVRDHFGIKPLHYHWDGATLRFGSEIKTLLQDPAVPRCVNYQALHYFLNLRYIPGALTLFDGIVRLPPAHYLVLENNALRIEHYFILSTRVETRRDETFYVEGIRHHLREAVRKQLMSDVPLGVYLSGGLDSSALVAFASELLQEPAKTFTLGFDEPTDENADARVVANYFKSVHHELTLHADPLREFPRVIWHAEEPKENILQGFLLSRFAREHVKVALGGLGGDELFAGYTHNRYLYPLQAAHKYMPGLAQHYALHPLSRAAFGIENALGAPSLDEYRRAAQLLCALGDIERYYLILRNVWDDDVGMWRNVYGAALRAEHLNATHAAFDPLFVKNGHSALEQVLWAEFHTKMVDDFLLNEDRTSMAHGLEVRVPFLDVELVKFAFSIPVDLKIRGNEPKYIFRRAMQGILPEHALRKPKWGFSFNPYFQFQKDLRTVAEHVLTRERVQELGWFNYAYLRRILEHPPHPRLRWHYFFLWLAVGLHIWHDMFIAGNVRAPEFDLNAYLS